MTKTISNCGCDVFSPAGYENHLTLNSDDGSLNDRIQQVGEAWRNLKYPNPVPMAPAVTGYIQRVYDDHVVIEDGEKLFIVQYTREDDGTITFDERSTWQEVALEKKYVPVTTNDLGTVQADAVSDDRADVGRNKLYKEKRPMEPSLLQRFLKSIGINATVVTNDDEDTDLSVVLNNSTPAPAVQPVALDDSLKSIGGVAGLVTALNTLATNVTALNARVDGLVPTVDGAQAMIANQAARDDAEKATIIAGMVANAACPFTEDELKGKPLNEVIKLNSLVNRTAVDYRALGGALEQNSTQAPVAPPAFFFARVAEKK